MGGTGMKDVGGAVLAGSSPPFRGRERAAVDVDVGPDDDDAYYYMRWRLKLEGETDEGCGGRSACWKYAAVSGSGAGGRRC